ncbi:MAG: hypothetical protein SNI45_05605 [Rikenellaceae bacterium]
MIKLDSNSLLKELYPELGDDPIATIEEFYKEAYYTMEENKGAEFDAEDLELFELFKSRLLQFKVIPHVQDVVNKSFNREFLSNEARNADKIKIDPKHKITSSKIYSFLKSLDDDSIRAIIGGVTDDQEEYDTLTNAIESDEEDLFVTIVRKYNNIKLQNICAYKLGLQNDAEVANKIMLSDQINTHNCNDEGVNSEVEEFIEENARYTQNVIEVTSYDELEKMISTLVQAADISMSVRERKKLKQFFEDPIVKSIFDGNKYISETRPDKLEYLKSIRNIPGVFESVCQLLNIDESELFDNHKEDPRKVSTTCNIFRSMLIGSEEKKDEIVAKLQKYIDEKGKVAGIKLSQLVMAASEIGWLVLPDIYVTELHSSMVDTFGNKLGTYEALQKGLKAVEDLNRFLNIKDAEYIDSKKQDRAVKNREAINGIRAQLNKMEIQ